MSFELGMLVQTAGVSEQSSDPSFANFVLSSIRRHASQDWGELCAEDKELNDESVDSEGRLLSAYVQPGTGVKIYIITEWDRSVTTVLFPEEY